MMEFGQLREELKKALQRQGVKAETVLKDLKVLKDMEQKVLSLEKMGQDMQKKVIALQQDKDRLEERLMRGAPLSVTAEIERRQNLELKEEVSRLPSAKDESSAEENASLAEQLNGNQHLCVSLQEQLKEILEPSTPINICGQSSSSPSSSSSNQPSKKTDVVVVEKAGEDIIGHIFPPTSMNNKYSQTDKPSSPSSESKRRDSNKSSSQSRDRERNAEIQSLTQKVKTLQTQVKKLEAENLELTKKSSSRSSNNNDSSSDDDDGGNQESLKHKPKPKVKTLERQIQVLQSENIRLVDKFDAYAPNTGSESESRSGSSRRPDPEEVIERIVELEDLCTDLQERLRDAEGQERHVRDKLRLAEQTINELEASEAQYRDRSDELALQERETKKQLLSLQTTGRELREIILDKEVLEQALKEKVEFLEKVEEQSTQRIYELESVEKSLREQLQDLQLSASSPGDPLHQQNLTLKEKLATLEQENRSLQEKNSELEENEEILRENWRRVADEDANRLKCLEEKVRMLEVMNQDLKTKVAEAQDFVVINSGPAQGSLADELSASASASAGRRVRSPHSHSPVSGSSDGEESGEESPRKKVVKLKRQLSLLEEEKNSKIAGLQERLGDLKENEIKLSECLAEMEMTERELRAKIALYESSEVTVEKMLKYQDKIDELTTSQESLLDQLETMENQEMTLQEQLEETERTLKGKILSLEVEMKNLKQKEHKGNARIRELEKTETELREKLEKQAEKENGLYVRISGLMDQIKELKAKVSQQDKKLAEKDERCRRVASLEAKFLQIEGAYREKVTSLEQTLADTQSQMETRDQEHSQRVFILQQMSQQQEQSLQDTITSLRAQASEHTHTEKELRDQIAALHSEKDTLVSEHLQKETDLTDKVSALQTDRDLVVSEQAQMEKDLTDKIATLQAEKDMVVSEQLQKENDLRDKVASLENTLSEKEARVSEHSEKETAFHAKVASLESALSEKEMAVTEKERIFSEKVQSLEKSVSERETLASEHTEREKSLRDRIASLEISLSQRDAEVSELSAQIESLKSSVSERDRAIGEHDKVLSERDERIVQCEADLSKRQSNITQLEQVISSLQSKESQLQQSVKSKDERVAEIERDLVNKTDRIDCLEKYMGESKSSVTKLENEVVDLRGNIGEKDKTIRELERELSETVVCVSELEREMDRKDEQIAEAEKAVAENKLLKSRLVETESIINELKNSLHEKDGRISKLEQEVNRSQSQRNILEKDTSEKDGVISRLESELREREQKISQLESDVIVKREEVSKVSADFGHKDTTITTLQADLSTKESRLKQLESVLEDREAQLVQLEAQIESKDHEFSAKLQAAQQEALTKDTHIADMEEKVVQLSSTLADLERKEMERDTLLRERDTHISNLQAQLAEKDSISSQQVSQLQSTLETEQLSASSKLSSLEEELTSTRTQLSQAGENSKRLVTVQQELEEERTRVQTLQQEMETLVEEKKHIQAQLAQKVSDLESQLSDQEADFETLTSARVTEFQLTRTSLEEELENLRDDLREKGKVIERLESTKNDLLSKLENMKDSEREMASKVSEAELNLSTLSLQKDGEMKEVKATWELRLRDTQHLTDTAQEKVRLLEADLESRNHTVQQQLEKISQLQTDLNTARSENVSLQSSLSQLQAQEKTQREELVQQETMLKTRMAQVETQLKDEQSRTGQDRAQLLARSNSLEESLLQARTELTNTCAVNVQLKQSEAELKRHMTSMQEEVDGLKTLVKDLEISQEREKEVQGKLRKDQERLEDEVRSLRDDKHSALTKVADLETESTTLRERESKLKKEARESKEETDRLTKELDTLKKEVQTQRSAGCQRQQQLEQREKELLERIADVETSVIVPLEAENAELKEELSALKQQVAALNLQLDKQEEQWREDITELDTLRTTVNDLQMTRTEAVTKLDNVNLELRHLQSQNEVLEHKVTDLQALNQTLTDQLKTSKRGGELHTLQHSQQATGRDVTHNTTQETQTQSPPGSTWVMENEWQNLQQKVRVLQDAEGNFMSRIMDLEELEEKLREELESARRQLKEKDTKLKEKDTNFSHSQQQQAESKPDTTEVSVDTEDLEDNISRSSSPSSTTTTTTKVPELFARVQELESTNQRLSASLEQATAGETDRRQMAERLQVLELAEERLMERVMQLEEVEVSLSNQLERSKHRLKIADQLEEEVSLLLQQEDEWRDKVAALTSEKDELTSQVDSIQNQLAQEKARAGEVLETRMDMVREEYEEKLSALEEREKQLERQLEEGGRSSQGESRALRQEVQVLREEMEDVCERYKDLEQENSRLRHQHSQLCEQLSSQDRTQALEQRLAGGVTTAREPPMLAAKTSSVQGAHPSSSQSQSSLPSSKMSSSVTSDTVSSVSSSHVSSSSPDSQYSSQPPSLQEQVCSTATLQMTPSPMEAVPHTNTSSRPVTHTNSQPSVKKEVHQHHHTSPHTKRSSVESSFDSSESSSGVHSASSSSSTAHTVRILTMHDVLEENASLKAQLSQFKSLSLAQDSVSQSEGGRRRTSSTPSPLSSSSLSSSSETAHHLQNEVARLQGQVSELQKSLEAAQGAVQEVVTVVRTRSVHTLEQKIETIQRTIHTQSPAWSLHQELLELLTTQADLQKQVSHLMETEHNLRVTLKQVEDELARVKSESGPATLGARRYDTERRHSLQSRLARFGGGISSTKAHTETSRGPVDIDQKSKEQWLERQVAELQLAKTNLERRLHEAERRLAFRPRTTSASRDELLFRIEQLEGEQREWRRKVEDLEALNSHYLKEKLELAQELRLQTQSPNTSKDKDVSVLIATGTRRQEPLGSSGSASEAEQALVGSRGSNTSSVDHHHHHHHRRHQVEDEEEDEDDMRERPEDVLQKRIKELENLESYLRQQLSEVEADREHLHEMGRKDKATIHEQNVRLRELLLQERNLRSQVTSLEDSERSLYNRCSQLEENVSRLEDRVHELEVHERRLRELVRKLKLDEEVWLSQSGDLTASMEQLTSSELTLRKTVQDLQLEKSGLLERTEYLELRVKELESLEASLVQRLNNYENVESSLQSKLHHTENSEAAAHSKASELDVINMDLSSRLQRAVEENAVLSQHVAQQQGQIHSLDRQMSAASDAQVSLQQHVDSLQKNEAALQKKVREYELRDIDAQARVRELEQTEEILKDKVNKLQRNDNRLKARLAQLETANSLALEKHQVPQQLEECQKRVISLQQQLEAAHAQSQIAPSSSTLSAESKDGGATSVTVPTAAFAEMRSQVALLRQSEYQVRELEKLNAQLSENILQLRQGKGSCGHEVELEVLKRRLHSYQNTIQEMKQNYLSEGQVPSLGATDAGQGPESDILPARTLQGLESERVLHSVRSLTHQPPGATHAPRNAQAHNTPGAATTTAATATSNTGDLPSEEEEEESRWRRVEQRRHLEGEEGEQRGAPQPPHASQHYPHTTAATTTHEELEMGVTLPSESERSRSSSVGGAHQNDTDSETSGIARRPRLAVRGSTATSSTKMMTTHTPGSNPKVPIPPGVVPAPRGGGGGREAQSSPMPTARNKPPSNQATNTPLSHTLHKASSGFVTDDSFYLPSSAPLSEESQEEGGGDAVPPPLPSTAPPGLQMTAGTPQTSATTQPPSSSPHLRHHSQAVTGTLTVKGSGEGGKRGVSEGEGHKVRVQTSPLQPASLQTTSAVGISIRQRIAQIERQLKENPSQAAGSKADDEDVFTWKAKATENARLLGAADREGKQLKEDINKLEKDLEEKRRYIYIFEKWLLDADEVLKNKNKRQDRDLVQQLQTELRSLRGDLANAGHRPQDISTDPPALRTLLEHRDRELMAKKSELESLSTEVERWRGEASSVEKMRANALDSLRQLETEVTALQDADTQLKSIKDDYNNLRGQYDEVTLQKNKAVSAVHTLRAKVTRLAKKCQEKDEMLRRLSEEIGAGGRGRSSSVLEELSRLESMAGGEEYNRPLSPLDLITGPTNSDTERLMSERIPPQTTPFARWSSLTSLGEPHDFNSGDTNMQPSNSKTTASSGYRPKSAEQIRKHSSIGPGVGFGMGGGSDMLCVAIMDYTPDAASRSGHRHLELSLKEGDQVRVQGPVDRHGYCEAEVGGQTGLVPASHLYPITEHPVTAGHKPAARSKSAGVGESSAEQITAMFKELDDPRIMFPVVKMAASHASQQMSSSPASLQKTPLASRHSSSASTATQTRQRLSVTKTNAVPEAPSGLHVKEAEGSTVVLSWQPPPLDQHGCSQGCKVVGYRIYLNGRVCQQPHNPRLTHTRMEGVRGDRPQLLAIQTLAASGQTSARVELSYQAGSTGVRGLRGEDLEETDLSSILNSIQYKTGRRRSVMGLYDYDPEKQSPGDFPACELSFRAGDLMVVYGEERQDGFYHGERNGKRGLVPACFVEPVNHNTKPTQKPGPSNGTTAPQS